MILKLVLLDVQTPSLSALSASLVRITGQKIDVPIGGKPLDNFLDCTNDTAAALESVVAHILACGDNAALMQTAILLKSPLLLISNNAAILTVSLKQIYDYVVINTATPNTNPLVNDLFSISKSLGIFDDHVEHRMSSGLKLCTR